MTLIIPEGYANFVTTWTSTAFDGGTAVTVFGMGEPLGPDPTALGVAAGVVRTAWEQNVLPRMDSGVVLTSVEAIGAVDSAVSLSGTAGGRTETMPPPNVATLVNKRVSGRGRRRQGRMFLPGLLDVGEVTEAGVIEAGALSDIQDRLADFLGDIVAGNECPMVILQNSEGETPPVSPPPVVDALEVRAKVASQRKRLRR